MEEDTPDTTKNAMEEEKPCSMEDAKLEDSDVEVVGFRCSCEKCLKEAGLTLSDFEAEGGKPPSAAKGGQRKRALARAQELAENRKAEVEKKKRQKK